MTIAVFNRRGIRIEVLGPLVDRQLSNAARVVANGDATSITVETDGGAPYSLGVRIAVTGCRAYLRNGFQSWDGCYFVAPGTPAGDGPPAKAPTLGYAMTALLPLGSDGAVVIGADRHDRFQTRLTFGGTAERLVIDIECLLDGTGETRAETLHLFDGDAVEPSLRRWSERVAAASPTPPILPERRLTGWCSWYNHYAEIDEATIRGEIASAKAFRDAHEAPLDTFLIDDGFTPEMGDWLDFRPTFPNGVAPLLAEAEAAGFRPGLWMAPFLVGNRSRLAAEHPNWLVQDRATGAPFVCSRYYGEFRWHKRSEEYHVLDITHPDAADYMRRVFATWTRDWGARYLKLDFLHHGAEYGPEQVRWHQDGLSRVAIYRRMLELARETVGPDVLLLGCGCPLWNSVGLVHGMRIGRDIGVSWHGEYSADSLLRDLLARNHGHGVLWQADPDCVLLRDRYHHLTDGEVEALARFAAGAGGVLMTSDTLDQLPPARAALFAELLREQVTGCDFVSLGREGAVVEQHLRSGDQPVGVQLFNPSDAPAPAGDGTLVPAHALLRR
jgi:alpha-galactosidase